MDLRLRVKLVPNRLWSGSLRKGHSGSRASNPQDEERLEDPKREKKAGKSKGGVRQPPASSCRRGNIRGRSLQLLDQEIRGEEKKKKMPAPFPSRKVSPRRIQRSVSHGELQRTRISLEAMIYGKERSGRVGGSGTRRKQGSTSTLYHYSGGK